MYILIGVKSWVSYVWITAALKEEGLFWLQRGHLLWLGGHGRASWFSLWWTRKQRAGEAQHLATFGPLSAPCLPPLLWSGRIVTRLYKDYKCPASFPGWNGMWLRCGQQNAQMKDASLRGKHYKSARRKRSLEMTALHSDFTLSQAKSIAWIMFPFVFILT